MKTLKLLCLALAVSSCCAGQASIAATVVASMNAEIRVAGAASTDTIGNPSGIRTFSGATSTLFFNVEGSTNFPFEVLSVADFALPAEPAAIGIVGASLTLFEDPASFAIPGPINVYLAGNTAANLLDATANPVAGSPSYQSGSNGFAAIDSAFAPFATLLGTGNFTASGIPGTPVVVPLSLSGPELAAAVAAVKAGGNLRLVVTPGNSTVAFTGAGQGNTDGAPPTLSYQTVVPEPRALALCCFGLVAAGALRRRS